MAGGEERRGGGAGWLPSCCWGGGPRQPPSRTPLQTPRTHCVHRVKVALAKKEEAVSSLRKQHQVGPQWVRGEGGLGIGGRHSLTTCVLQAAVKRADHLEELLDQRRRPLPSAK